MLQELHPKNDLERAYAQARCWTPMQAWRRGTVDLRCGRLTPATGTYLALARALALEGRIQDFEETLNCVCNYGDALTADDKQSVVRVLCAILEEVKQQFELQSKWPIERQLVYSAVAVTAQIKGNKSALMDAVFNIKRVADLDLIAERITRKEIKELKNFIYESKVDLTRLAGSKKSLKILRTIAAKADKLPGQFQILEMLIDVARLLIDQNQLELAKVIAHDIVRYTLGVVRTEYPDTEDYSAEPVLTPQNHEVGRDLVKTRADLGAAIDSEENLVMLLKQGKDQYAAWLGRAEMAKEQANDYLVKEALKNAEIYARNVQNLEVKLITQRESVRQIKRRLADCEQKLSTESGKNVLRIERDRAAARLKPSHILAAQEIDNKLIELFSLLGDSYGAKNLSIEASEFYAQSVFAQIRLKEFGMRAVRDLINIASVAVICGQYDRAFDHFNQVKRLLPYFGGSPQALPEAETLCNLCIHLFGHLMNRTEHLDEMNFNALTFLVDKNIGLKQQPLAARLLPHILELLYDRCDKNHSEKVINNLWICAFNFLPQLKNIFSIFIQPLAIMTEQLMGSASGEAFLFYASMGTHLQQTQGAKELELFWRVILAIREEQDGKKNISLIPVLSELAMHYSRNTQPEQCFEICERIRSVNKRSLYGNRPTRIVSVQCLEAMSSTANLYSLLGKTKERKLMSDQVTKLIAANESRKDKS